MYNIAHGPYTPPPKKQKTSINPIHQCAPSYLENKKKKNYSYTPYDVLQFKLKLPQLF